MESNLILLILLVLALSQAVMVLYFLMLNRRQQKEAVGGKDFDLIHDAIKKSQAIISQAELAGIKQTAVSSQETNKLELEILEITKREMVKAGEDYKQELIEQTELIKRLSETETKKVLEDFRGQMDKRMHEIQDGFAKDLALYKAKKEQAIDNNIEEIVDRAVELYLGKKLDKKEQMQLIFEALERAKQEKSIV